MTPMAAMSSTPNAIPTPSPAFAGVERPGSGSGVAVDEAICVACAESGVVVGGAEDVVEEDELVVAIELLDEVVGSESTTSPVALRKTPWPFSQQFASLSQHQL